MDEVMPSGTVVGETNATDLEKARSLFRLAAILVAALALRLVHLGTRSLWRDEGASIRDAHHIIQLNRMRPLYYLLLNGWMHLGTSEAWLRLPAVLFSLGGITLLYGIGRRLTNTRTATVACLLMAVAVSEVDHAQEVRMYTLASLCVLGAVALLLRWLETRAPAALAGHVVCCLLALLTTPVTLLGLVPTSLIALYSLRRERRALLLLTTAYTTAVAVWVPYALLAFGAYSAFTSGEDHWIDRPHLGSLLALPVHLLTTRSLYGVRPVEIAFLGLLALVCLVLIVTALKGGGQQLEARSARMLALWFFPMPVLVFAYSLLRAPLWTPRYFQSIAPGFYLLLALGITSLWRKSHALGGLAALLLFGTTGGYLLRYYASPGPQDWQGAAAWVQAHADADDAVCVLSGTDDQVVWDYYYHGSVPVTYVHVVLRPGEKPTAKTIAEALAQVHSPADKTWIVTAWFPPLGEAGFYTTLEAYLNAHYTPVEKFSSESIEVLDFRQASAAFSSLSRPEPAQP